MKNFNPPSTGVSCCTDPEAGMMINLLGGAKHASVSITNDQLKNLGKLYGFEGLGNRGVGIEKLQLTGAQRSVFRFAERDGLRAIALLAKFCEPGTDPILFLAEMMVDFGLDVLGLASWLKLELEKEDEQSG